jgi:hypothetical protein
LLSLVLLVFWELLVLAATFLALPFVGRSFREALLGAIVDLSLPFRKQKWRRLLISDHQIAGATWMSGGRYNGKKDANHRSIRRVHAQRLSTALDTSPSSSATSGTSLQFTISVVQVC